MTDVVKVEDVVESSLSEGWDLFKNDWVLYLVATLLLVVVSFFSLGLLAPFMVVGFIKLAAARMRGEEATATDIFGGFSHFGSTLIAMILIGLGVFVGTLLLVLPGLLFAIATAFTFHAIALDDAGATEAISTSFALIKDNLWPTLLLLLIVIIINAIGGAVIFGALVTTPIALIVMTIAYQRLRGTESVAQA